MCQITILNFMQELRKSGDMAFYTCAEIMQKMTQAGQPQNNKSFHEKVTRLWWFGFLEKSEELKNGKGKLYNKRMFRSKVQ